MELLILFKLYFNSLNINKLIKQKIGLLIIFFSKRKQILFSIYLENYLKNNINLFFNYLFF